VLNTNLTTDVQVLHDSQTKNGITNWFAGQRNGQSGLKDPDTSDIENYRSAVYWIDGKLTANPTYLTDDTRCWVNIPAI